MEQQADLSSELGLLTAPPTDGGDVLAAGVSPRPKLRAALRHRSLAIGIIICLAIIALVVIGPFFISVNPNAQNAADGFLPPSSQHLMGTDSFGRDVFARVLFGGRATLLASAAVVVLGGTAGSVIGLIAGIFGGPVNFVLMRLVDLMLAFPGILLALAVAAILGPGLVNGVIAVAIVLVPIYARLVERATIVVRTRPYVDAAVTLGAGVGHILRRHIIPNVSSSLIVLSTSWIGIAALWIAGLGFLGLGVQPPSPEWGAILNEGANYITIAWWITVFPGAILALYVVGMNLVGDGLRDQLDPTVSRR
jgi:ABC-type dipeptide/oligopeptide/nickel transport system permease subunit